MPSVHNLQPISLEQTVEMSQAAFCECYPHSHFLIDGAGYEDEDLGLNIYTDIQMGSSSPWNSTLSK